MTFESSASSEDFCFRKEEAEFFAWLNEFFKAPIFAAASEIFASFLFSQRYFSTSESEVSSPAIFSVRKAIFFSLSQRTFSAEDFRKTVIRFYPLAQSQDREPSSVSYHPFSPAASSRLHRMIILTSEMQRCYYKKTIFSLFGGMSPSQNPNT